MPQPLYPQGKSPWYPLDRRLGVPQSHSGCGGVLFIIWLLARGLELQKISRWYLNFAALTIFHLVKINVRG
jgi:hypothetical protein